MFELLKEKDISWKPPTRKTDFLLSGGTVIFTARLTASWNNSTTKAESITTKPIKQAGSKMRGTPSSSLTAFRATSKAGWVLKTSISIMVAKWELLVRGRGADGLF